MMTADNCIIYYNIIIACMILSVTVLNLQYLVSYKILEVFCRLDSTTFLWE